MRIPYTSKRLSRGSQDTIEIANAIGAEYADQDLDITLRQLGYQFVSRGLMPNTNRHYKRLGRVVSDARLTGQLDWDYIVDRTRHVRSMPHWNTPSDMIAEAAQDFQYDKWAEQPTVVEVWVEKDALMGVLDSICPDLDVAYCSCRGYTSQSEMWGAAQRIGSHLLRGQNVVIAHFGDHDPSGIDMSRDIEERLQLFTARDKLLLVPRTVSNATRGGSLLLPPSRSMGQLTVNRIALNMDQIERYGPPPNPAKVTDTRYRRYRTEFGGSSWELDALDPTVLVALIEEAVIEHRDQRLWDAATTAEEEAREQLQRISDRWDEVSEVFGS